MNIQLAEGYKNAEKGEKERGFWAVGAGGSREEGHLEPGLERRSRSRGPEAGARTEAGAREKESEPGARTRKMESEPGPERR